MTELKFYFLGPPCFRLNGSPVKVGRRKAVALAAYLTLTGIPHSREHLADLFWPEYDRDKSRASLRRTLSVMTNALGKFWLKIDRDMIEFAPHEDLWVDVTGFRQLIAQSVGGVDAMAALEKAAEIYQNKFMAGFSIGEAPDFEDWQFDQSEELCREAIGVRERLADKCMSQMDFPGAVTHARNWVGLDSLNEAAHRQLILAYRKNGQSGNALRQYEKCKDLLQRELDVQPHEKTTALATKIKTSFHDASPSFFPVKMNLPAQSTPFVGRKEDINALMGRMIDPKIRLLTLTGPGGIGKTRLAVEAASALADQFSQRVFFIPLAGLSSTESMVACLARIFGLSSGGQIDPLKQVMDFLGPGKTLVVLDNFEHLTRARGLVSQMLNQAPGLKIMVTSRTRLMLKREHLFPLSGLLCPGVSPPINDGRKLLTTAETYDAVTLFLSIARMVSPDLKLSAQNFPGIARICDLTGGMPLALILAAGWADVLPPDLIADGIVERLDFLKAGIHDFPSCHKSMQAVFDASWSQLPADEKNLFLKLAVFKDGFTLDALGGVVGMPKDAAANLTAMLVRKSMIKVDPKTGWFEIHSLLRQYGREGLTRLCLMEKMMDAHKRYYLNLAHENSTRLIGKGMLACRGEMDGDFANICQAWYRAVAQRDFLSLGHSVRGIYLYFDMHTRYHEGEAFFRPAKELVMGVCTPDSGPGFGMILLCWFDMQASGFSLPPDVLEIEKTAQSWLRKSIKDTRTRAVMFLLLGAIAQGRALYTRAIRFYGLSLKADPEIEASFWVTIRMGTCLRVLDNMDQAIVKFSQSHKIGIRLGDSIKTAWSLGNLGSAHLCSGNLETAKVYLEQADAAFKRICAPLGIVTTLEERALLSFLKGDITQSIFLADQVLAMSEDPGLALAGYQRACALKGLALVAANNLDGGIFLEKVLKIGVSDFTTHLGMVFWACLKKDISLAQSHLKLAEKWGVSVHKTQLKTLLLLARAAVFERIGEDEGACELLSILFYHPSRPSGLFNTWKLPEIILSRLESRMLPEKFKGAWDLGNY